MLLKPPDYLLPAPAAVFREAVGPRRYFYLDHAMRTVGATLLGFAAALVVGVHAGGRHRLFAVLENTLYTLLVAFNSVPKIALAPIFIIWMGTGLISKVAISFLIALFAHRGRCGSRPALGRSRCHRSVSRNRGDRLQTLLWLRLPNALPHLFAGMKVAISLALVGTIAGEFVASQAGLGYVILSAQGAFQTTRVFAAVILLGLWHDPVFSCRFSRTAVLSVACFAPRAVSRPQHHRLRLPRKPISLPMQ